MKRRITEFLLDKTQQTARAAANADSATLRFGTVTAVQTTPKTITCTLAGETLRGVPYMASYSPTIGDVVWLLHQGSTLVAIGKR